MDFCVIAIQRDICWRDSMIDVEMVLLEACANVNVLSTLFPLSRPTEYKTLLCISCTPLCWSLY